MRIIFRPFEYCEVGDQFISVFSCPRIKTGEQDFVGLEDRFVVDGFLLGEIGKGIFDTGFEGEMLGLFDFKRVFQFERVLKITFSLEIAEGVKSHALSCLLQRLFSWR
ncbi:hypothetical protein D3C78_1720270 [compost metagenome]